MRRILGICLCSISALAASYDKAFLERDYERAYSEAMAACELDCNDASLNLIIGKSAYELGNLHEALAAYDRVLIADEQNVEAHFAMAKIYASKGNYELLEAEIEALNANPNLNSAQRAKLDKYKRMRDEQINDQGAEVKKYSVYLSAGFSFDSNPKRENNKSYRIFIDDESYIAKDSKSPSALGFISSVYASYEMDLTNSSALEINASWYHKNYFKSRKQDYPNIDVFSLTFTPKYYVNDNSQLALSLGYDYIILKGHGFLNSLHAGFDVYQSIGDKYYLSAGYSYSKGLFEKSWDKEDNYNHHNLYSGLNIAFGEQSLGLSISLDSEKAPNSFSYGSDYFSYGLGLSHFYPFSADWVLNSSLNYTRTSYKKSDPLYRSKRRDNDYFVSSELSYKITPNQQIASMISYAISSSNQDGYDSNNLGISISYRYTF